MRRTSRNPELTARIAARLRAARERAGLTQYQLAVGLGLNHRQIVTRIEDGQRSLTAEELIRAMDLLGVDLDYFTDTFRLEGEGEFTFRTGPDVTSAAVDEFRAQSGAVDRDVPGVVPGAGAEASMAGTEAGTHTPLLIRGRAGRG